MRRSSQIVFLRFFAFLEHRANPARDQLWRRAPHLWRWRLRRKNPTLGRRRPLLLCIRIFGRADLPSRLIAPAELQQSKAARVKPVAFLMRSRNRGAAPPHLLRPATGRMDAYLAYPAVFT
jgi:hypothetical protein